MLPHPQGISIYSLATLSSITAGRIPRNYLPPKEKNWKRYIRINPTGTTPLISRHTRLAIIKRARTRTRINNLHSNAIPHSANNRAAVPSLVAHFVAFTACCLWARRPAVAADGVLAAAFGGVDWTAAFGARPEGREVREGGAVGPWCAGFRAAYRARWEERWVWRVWCGSWGMGRRTFLGRRSYWRSQRLQMPWQQVPWWQRPQNLPYCSIDVWIMLQLKYLLQIDERKETKGGQEIILIFVFRST